jgi:hypothetical protein
MVKLSLNAQRFNLEAYFEHPSRRDIARTFGPISLRFTTTFFSIHRDEELRTPAFAG